MSSPLVAALDQIDALWEALTPPDRTDVTYHSIANRVLSTGASGDRSFYPDPSPSSEPTAEAGVDATQVWWDAPYRLRLQQSGLTRGAAARAVANEVALLSRAVMKVSSWPANVLDVVYAGHEFSFSEGDDQGDLLVTINLRVLTSETD